jgi:hypothetical protein
VSQGIDSSMVHRPQCSFSGKFEIFIARTFRRSCASFQVASETIRRCGALSTEPYVVISVNSVPNKVLTNVSAVASSKRSFFTALSYCVRS